MDDGRSAPAQGLADVITDVSRHAREIVRLEAELAVTEVRGKVTALRPVAVVGGLAAVLGLLGAGFGAAAAAALLALVLPWWAALIIVSAGLIVLAAACGAFVVARARAVTPLLPELALGDARATVDELAGRLS
jgi:hypothetical protein